MTQPKWNHIAQALDHLRIAQNSEVRVTETVSVILLDAEAAHTLRLAVEILQKQGYRHPGEEADPTLQDALEWLDNLDDFGEVAGDMYLSPQKTADAIRENFNLPPLGKRAKTEADWLEEGFVPGDVVNTDGDLLLKGGHTVQRGAVSVTPMQAGRARPFGWKPRGGGGFYRKDGVAVTEFVEVWRH